MPPDAKIPAGQWRGRVETAPVKLTVQPKPPRLSPEDQMRRELDFADFYLATHQAAKALKHAKNAVAANPKDVRALATVAESKESAGDLQGALAAYSGALAEFVRQNPNPPEPPAHLLDKVRALRDKTDLKP